MVTRDIKDFFRELRKSEEYKRIKLSQLIDEKETNPNKKYHLDSEQASLSNITDIIELFVWERFSEIFPCADPDTRERAKGKPYDKAYDILTDYSPMPMKKRSVEKLFREVAAASEECIPLWCIGERKKYFENSHINYFLN